MHYFIFPRLVGVTKSKEPCDSLQQAYQGTDKLKIVKLQSLRREFETLCKQNYESIEDFLTTIMSIVNEIQSHGEDLKDQKIVENILRSLSAKFDGLLLLLRSLSI